MAIKIDTTKYERSHGKAPQGGGAWMFEFTAHEYRAEGAVPVQQTITTPACMPTLRSAIAEAKRIVRRDFRMQDAVLFVCP